MRRISSRAFYSTYHGHDEKYLSCILETLKQRCSGVIYLAGDSSLDNKYWIDEHKPAVNGYEQVLEPPFMKADVCFWLNRLLKERSQPLFAVNTAVEATTLGQRSDGWFSEGLLEQDQFIRDNITEEDYLVVSVGGNDIALSPSMTTIASMLTMVHLSSDEAIQAGSAWGMGHFFAMFGDQLAGYIERLVQKRKPRKVLVCMIYYPDVVGRDSWADAALSALSYNSDPARLQSAISAVFDQAVSQISIGGTEVVPVPLFRVLDGTRPADYVARVEPSEEGGRRIAQALLEEVAAAPRGRRGAEDGDEFGCC